MSHRFEIPYRSSDGLHNLDVAGIVDWCRAHFGISRSDFGNGIRSWDTYQNTMFDGDAHMVRCRVFIFYDDEDAMAFKLKWL